MEKEGEYYEEVEVQCRVSNVVEVVEVELMSVRV